MNTVERSNENYETALKNIEEMMNEVRLGPNGYEYDHYKPFVKAFGGDFEVFSKKYAMELHSDDPYNPQLKIELTTYLKHILIRYKEF